MGEQVALVTGASRGIGRAVVLALARTGRPVAVNYRSSETEAKETLALAEEAGGKGLCVQADVGEAAEVDRCFKEIEAAFGPVGVLVNNAGIRIDGLSVTLSDDAWDRVLRTNLYGTFACCRRALMGMVRARWGRIVNIASVAGLRGSPGQANYAAAKGGIIALTRTLAREVAGKGVTVNAVAPGLVSTDLTSELSEKQLDRMLSQIPQGRAGTAEEVASLVSFLCSDAASYITGSVFVADGGMSA